MIKNLAQIEQFSATQITVSCQQQSSCKSCAARSSCGSGILSNVMPSRKHQFQVQRPRDLSIQPKVGDWVEIGLQEESLIKGALLLYVMPLISMLIFAIVGNSITQSEGGAIIFAVLGLSSGLLAARYQSKKMVDKTSYQPVFIRYIGQQIPSVE